MDNKIVRVSGEVADEYWKEGLLWRYEIDDARWMKDDCMQPTSAPSRWAGIEFGILVEE